MDLSDNQHSLLTFRVGPVLCCAPSLPVESIITPPNKLTQPPGSNPANPGIFRHGSHIVKVIDLRQKFGVELSQQTQPGNLIITRFNDESTAFWIDQIIDVFDFPKEGWGNLPAAIPRGVFSRTLLLQQNIHLYSEFEKLGSIQDLGYLKHYIQQLQKLDKKSEAQDSSSVKEDVKTTTASAQSAANKTETHKTTSTDKHTKDNTDTEIKGHTETVKPALSTTVGNDKDPYFLEKNTNTPETTLSSISKPSNQPYVNTTSAGAKNDKSEQSRHVSVNSTNQHKAPLTASKLTAANMSSVNNAVRNEGKAASTTENTIAINKPAEQKNTYEQNASKHDPMHKTSIQTQVKNNIEDNESSYGILIFILIIISLLFILGYFLLFSTETNHEIQQNKTSSTVTSSLTNEKPSYTYPEPEPDNEILEEVEKQFSPTTKKDTVDKAITPQSNVNELINQEDNLLTKTTEPAQPYRADISQQQDEITITLHRPAPVTSEPEIEAKFATEIDQGIEEKKNELVDSPSATKEISPFSSSVKETITIKEESSVSSTTNEQEQIKDAEQSEGKIEINVEKNTNTKTKKDKAIQEFIHIVKKGDTLWAIAKKYVNDPFLYPELARLSNIKNPHRIYPGNRVRIRFINN